MHSVTGILDSISVTVFADTSLSEPIPNQKQIQITTDGAGLSSTYYQCRLFQIKLIQRDRWKRFKIFEITFS